MEQGFERRGLILGLLFGVPAGVLVLVLPNPTNVEVMRALGSPLLYVVGVLTFIVPMTGLLYYVVVPVQWALVGWLIGLLLDRLRRRSLSAAAGS